MARNHRQRGNGNSHSKDSNRKLHQAEGVIKPGDTPLLTTGRKVSIYKDINLGGGKADNSRDHELNYPAQAFVPKRQHGHKVKTHLVEGRQLYGELQESSYKCAYGHAH